LNAALDVEQLEVHVDGVGKLGLPLFECAKLYGLSRLQAAGARRSSRSIGHRPIISAATVRPSCGSRREMCPPFHLGPPHDGLGARSAQERYCQPAKGMQITMSKQPLGWLSCECGF
jgi:hypothetical protein